VQVALSGGGDDDDARGAGVVVRAYSTTSNPLMTGIIRSRTMVWKRRERSLAKASLPLAA